MGSWRYGQRPEIPRRSQRPRRPTPAAGRGVGSECLRRGLATWQCAGRRQGLRRAGKKLETGKVKATSGGKELPPPRGAVLEKLAGNSKQARNLRLKYSSAHGQLTSASFREITKENSTNATYGEASRRIVPEVTVKNDKILSVDKPPGGAPAGARNPDALITSKPITPDKWATLEGKSAATVGEATLDIKVGSGPIPDKPGLVKESGGLPAQEIRPYSTTSATCGRLRSVARTTGSVAKAVAPMIATEIWCYARDLTMDEVCRIMNKPAGTTTQDEIQWMEDHGYVNTGVNDRTHRLEYEKTWDRELVDRVWLFLHIPGIVMRSMESNPGRYAGLI
jgi:hypothetical protein